MLTYIAAKPEQPWTLRTDYPVVVGREPFGAKLESKAAASRWTTPNAGTLHGSSTHTHTKD